MAVLLSVLALARLFRFVFRMRIVGKPSALLPTRCLSSFLHFPNYVVDAIICGHLEGLQLSDSSDSAQRIDVLIGSDYYCNWGDNCR